MCVCVVFAYGATGAGKTHTMLGSSENPGVMYLTMKELFNRMDLIKEEKVFDIAFSYLEVIGGLITRGCALMFICVLLLILFNLLFCSFFFLFNIVRFLLLLLFIFIVSSLLSLSLTIQSITVIQVCIGLEFSTKNILPHICGGFKITN